MKTAALSLFFKHRYLTPTNLNKRVENLHHFFFLLTDKKKNHPTLAIGYALLAMVLSSCSENSTLDLAANSCIECHKIELDEPHSLACTSCHQGDSKSRIKDIAHFELIHQPSHPDNMAKACGPCHAGSVENSLHSLHFTLNNSINIFRKAFGAIDEITTFLDTPVSDTPDSSLALADDLLRRRCFRCHPYSKGDDYPAVTRGTGCASCHLSYAEGKLKSHAFQSPRDSQCLSCHYGNYVGSDYYGRFEHDFNDEYRTPYTTKEAHFRPFGIEYHQLKRDIHQIRGMICIDCHSGQTLMNKNDQNISCKDCHLKEDLNHSPRPGITQNGDTFLLHSKTGKNHPLPVMKHAAHFNQKNDIDCQVCHAQWSFGDDGKHFLRSDLDDYDPWYLLSIQANSELEEILTNNMDFEKTELPPTMSDKITGVIKPGLWYKGFTQRRWGNIILGRNYNGTITILRPMLDITLTWVDEDETIRFESISPQLSNNGYLPYTPHTTGPAGLFYNERIRSFIENEKNKTNPNLTTKALEPK